MPCFACPMMFWALELILLTKVASHGPEHAERLSYERTKLEYSHGMLADRRLTDSEEWAPMRIHAHTDELRSDLTRSPGALRYLEDDLIPAGIRWLSEILQVRPVQGHLGFEQLCRSFWSDGTCSGLHSESSRCGTAGIPQAHLKDRRVCGRRECQVSKGGEGIRNSDFALYITAKLDQCPDGVAAFASVCRQDTNDRPIAGFINLCNLRDRVGMDIALFVHETMHALGFGADMFSFFRQDDGIPRTPRGRNGLPPVSGGRYTASSSTVAKRQLKDGTIRNYIVLPRVLDAAREHYGCPELDGVPLEDAGGDGSAHSHWDSRAMHTEMMSAQLSHFPRMSKITLALLEDSGWYKPVYENAGGFDFGSGKGCGFLSQACVQQGQTQFPDTFCPAGPERSCSRQTVSEVGCLHNSMGKAYCDKCVHSQALPSRFQYFVGKPHIGGSDPFLGFCPTWTPYNTPGGSSFCSDGTASAVDAQVRGESFGVASRCLMSTAMSARNFNTQGLAGTCYQTRCNKTGLEIQVGKQWIFCSAESEGNQIPVGNGWRGYVICPAYQKICKDRVGEAGTEVPCKFPSSPRHGRCVCAPGYLDENCAVEDTKANRDKLPYALNYRLNEIILEVGASAQFETRPTIAGNTNGLRYSVHPALPSGLSITLSTGVLSGSVRSPIHRAPYTVRAKGVQGTSSATLFITAVCPAGQKNCGELSVESNAGTKTTESPKTTSMNKNIVTPSSSTSTRTTEQPTTTLTTTSSTRAKIVEPTTIEAPATTVTPQTSVTAKSTTTVGQLTSSHNASGFTNTELPAVPTTSAGPSTSFSQTSSMGEDVGSANDEESSGLPLVIIAAAGGSLVIVFAALLLYCRCRKRTVSTEQSDHPRVSDRSNILPGDQGPVDLSSRPNGLPDDQWQALENMLEMGYDFDEARAALEQNGWDINRAVAAKLAVVLSV